MLCTLFIKCNKEYVWKSYAPFFLKREKLFIGVFLFKELNCCPREKKTNDLHKRIPRFWTIGEAVSHILLHMYKWLVYKSTQTKNFLINLHSKAVNVVLNMKLIKNAFKLGLLYCLWLVENINWNNLLRS